MTRFSRPQTQGLVAYSHPDFFSISVEYKYPTRFVGCDRFFTETILFGDFINCARKGHFPGLRSTSFEGKGLSDSVKIEDVPAAETWARLQTDAEAVLVDVRTRAEWTFVGIPDLSTLNKRVITVEWQTFPDSRIDPDFAGRLCGLLEGAGVSKDTEVFFLCRSGARSRSAAAAMADAGYTRCRNVEDGFEGPLDATQKRGHVAGWKAAGLPWRQG